MFPLEQGAFEMLLIGAIALIVVGPKDLPVLMRRVGQFTAKMRGLAAEFRASFDEMARQSELDELRKEVDALRTGQYTAPISAEIDKHMYGYDQTPTTYPSPVEAAVVEPAPEAVATVPAEALLEPAAKPKPRAKKAIVSADGEPAVAKPRKPRAAKPKPAAGEAAE